VLPAPYSAELPCAPAPPTMPASSAVRGACLEPTMEGVVGVAFEKRKELCRSWNTALVLYRRSCNHTTLLPQQNHARGGRAEPPCTLDARLPPVTLETPCVPLVLCTQAARAPCRRLSCRQHASSHQRLCLCSWPAQDKLNRSATPGSTPSAPAGHYLLLHALDSHAVPHDPRFSLVDLPMGRAANARSAREEKGPAARIWPGTELAFGISPESAEI
jgi:hypothetical protein